MSKSIVDSLIIFIFFIPGCLTGFHYVDLCLLSATFSRGFIRNKVGIDDSIRVTSPTYLLSNTYFYDEAGVKNE